MLNGENGLSFKLGELAQQVDAKIHGDPDVDICCVDTLQDAGVGAISFLANSKYKQYLRSTGASAVILRPEWLDECSTNALVCENPYLVYARLATYMYPESEMDFGVHSSAVVADSAVLPDDVSIGPMVVIGEDVELGKGVSIGPGSVVERGCRIGDGSRLVANVTICREVLVGKRALLHPGVVIGADGFGLANDNGVWEKVPQLGRVRIGDDVEIGANTTVDRGALRDTIIANGVKLDNLIQIGHNVELGEHVAAAADAAIAGSTKIGNRCTIGGAVAIAGHLELGDDVHISGAAMVSRSFDEPGYYSGNFPAVPNHEWRRAVARVRRLDEMMKKMTTLEREVAALRGVKTDQE